MGRKRKAVVDVQEDLIPDVRPANAKQIVAAAKKYKSAMMERVAALATEKELKQKVLALIKEARLVADPDGNIKYHVDDITITVKPRDELLRVKFDGDDEEEDGDE